jgi:hypothetical protein
MKNKDKYCHYSGLPSPAAYEKKTSKMKFINKYYPVGIAFICLLYSVDRDWFIVLLCCVAGFFFALTMLSIFL